MTLFAKAVTLASPPLDSVGLVLLIALNVSLMPIGCSQIQIVQPTVRVMNIGPVLIAPSLWKTTATPHALLAQGRFKKTASTAQQTATEIAKDIAFVCLVGRSTTVLSGPAPVIHDVSAV